ncbi:MAG: hypothetical protein ACLRJV_07200 [Eubacteriales bacterium]
MVTTPAGLPVAMVPQHLHLRPDAWVKLFGQLLQAAGTELPSGSCTICCTSRRWKARRIGAC